jgi:hypothetical protein
MIRAFASRTASVLVDFAFGREAGGETASAMPGSTGAGIVALRSTGCIVIGPVCRGARFFIPVKRSYAELVSIPVSVAALSCERLVKTPAMNGSITSGEYAVSTGATYAPVAACFAGERA